MFSSTPGRDQGGSDPRERDGEFKEFEELKEFEEFEEFKEFKEFEDA